MGSFTDLVTIAIPVYERKDFFEEALNSALNQTVNCQIIVQDNGSSHDFFKDTCAGYSNRVEYYKNDTNIGMFANWNKCIENSRTKFVMILGDDDIVSPNFIETFLYYLETYPDIQIYYSNFEYLFEPKKNVDPSDFNTIWGYHSMRELKEFAIEHGLGLPTISMVVDRSLHANSKYETKVHASNDWLHDYTLSDSVMVYGNQNVLLSYRKHPLSDTYSSQARMLSVSHAFILYQIAKSLGRDCVKECCTIIKHKRRIRNEYNALTEHDSAYREMHLEIHGNYILIAKVYSSLIWDKIKRIIKYKSLSK